MRELIDDIFIRHLANAQLDSKLDATPFEVDPTLRTLITTDSFTVQPLIFPGGDIGTLAVNGTVNDLAVSGAIAKVLTLSAIIEEGFEVDVLNEIVRSLSLAANAVGVKVIAGDTKVVPRGQGGGLYLGMTGIGVCSVDTRLSMDLICPRDLVIVSGPVGDHGIAVLLARGEFDLEGAVRSDCASIGNLAIPVAQRTGIRFMRDPTRGGIATVCHEIARATNLNLILDEGSIPVREPVRAVCAMLGYNPYYLACEGRVLAIVDECEAAELLSFWRGCSGGEMAAVIGTVEPGNGHVLLKTNIGGMRYLEELEDDPLPRIC
ncbi:MAG: hydrogenase expression/formation protein HypE [Alphaproteobacteria bacterium]|nr:hydrogenase expression/formation protein HypE [Alphaproteobacteria bacterium]